MFWYEIIEEYVDEQLWKVPDWIVQVSQLRLLDQSSEMKTCSFDTLPLFINTSSEKMKINEKPFEK